VANADVEAHRNTIAQSLDSVECSQMLNDELSETAELC